MIGYEDDALVTFICPECGSIEVMPYKSARRRKHCSDCAQRAETLAKQRWLERKMQKNTSVSENMQSISQVARAAAQAGVSYGVYVARLKEQAEQAAREKAARRPLLLRSRSVRTGIGRRVG